MTANRIEAILRQETGLGSRFLSENVLQRTVKKRMQDLGINDHEAYFAMLRSSDAELMNLIEEIVIPETFFFRDKAPFEAMLHHLERFWQNGNNKRFVKILSAPCATGEEPYSLAMALADAGVSPERYAVHGVDISGRLIARAKKGVYTSNSFRGDDLAFRDRFFTPEGKLYSLSPAIREKVRFHAGNVLKSSFMESLGLFDVIFFRNVMIYFDAASIKRAMATLNRILAANGILFVGHAEVNLVDDSLFAPASHIQAFAFHRKESTREALQPSEPPTASPPKAKARKRSGRKSPKKDTSTQERLPDLGLARQLADRGELAKAAALCEKHLQQCGPSADAFFLLGINCEAAGNLAEAETLYRKALYLEPHHEEILLFLSLLVEKKGDRKEAETLEKRLLRLQENNVNVTRS